MRWCSSDCRARPLTDIGARVNGPLIAVAALRVIGDNHKRDQRMPMTKRLRTVQ